MRRFKIPKFLHEFHGEESSLFNIIIIYLTGVTVGVLFFLSIDLRSLDLLPRIVGTLIMLDIAAGVVANLSSSTNLYYQQPGKRRLLFLWIHILHGGILIWVFPDYWQLIGGVTLLTLLVGTLMHFIKSNETRQMLAASTIVITITVALLFNPQKHIILLFPPLFMLKLLLGFSVRRPSLER